MKHKASIDQSLESTDSEEETNFSFIRPKRTTSPTVRPGPRHRSRDLKTDEFIRFVREFQRHDKTHQSPIGLKKRSVLPSIGSRGAHHMILKAAESMLQTAATDSESVEATAVPNSDWLEKRDNTSFKNTRQHSTYTNNEDNIALKVYSHNSKRLKSDSTNIGSPDKSSLTPLVFGRTNGRLDTKTTGLTNGPSAAAKLLLTRPGALRHLPPISHESLPHHRPSAPPPQKTISSTDTDEEEIIFSEQYVDKTWKEQLF